MSKGSIVIGTENGENDICSFLDELLVGEKDHDVGREVDHIDLIEVLKSELAPLKVWRSFAVEYHRQGFDFEFDCVLTEIVESLTEEAVQKKFKERYPHDYAEGMSDMFNALAANWLGNLVRVKETPGSSTPQDEVQCISKVVEYLKKADDSMRGVNDYTYIIKGFFEMRQGDFKRAEDHFRVVKDRASSKIQQKRKFLFGAIMGMGMVNFAQDKVQTALDYFIQALQSFPSCGASVRMAIATCCFKLKQYDRGKAALDRAFEMDPTNPDVLVLYALYEQSNPHLKQDRSSSLAQEYCMVATTIDPTCSMALNHLANFHFNSWKFVSVGTVQDSQNIRLCSAPAALDVSDGDLIRINSRDTELYVVKSVVQIGADLLVCIREPLGVVEDYIEVEVKSLSTVLNIAKKASESSSVKKIKAESLYIMGKVHHIRGDFDLAHRHYAMSFNEDRNMTLAYFGFAQISLSNQEFNKSLEMFETLHSQYPDDKDTHAYVLLLRSLQKDKKAAAAAAAAMDKEKEVVAPMDVIKEVATGFQFEIDLWLLQGQIRLSDHTEFTNALKCFLNAKDCLEKKQMPVDVFLYSNIAVLCHSLGKLQEAEKYAKLALIQCRDLGARTGEVNPNFKCLDLLDVFFTWSDRVFLGTFELCVRREGSGFEVTFVLPELEQSDFRSGEDVLVKGLLLHITEVVGGRVACSVPVDFAKLTGAAEGEPVQGCRKNLWRNCCDETLSLCFNYARILEDLGRTIAAQELYRELLKKRPSFIECYLRLSRIAREMGKFDAASFWLSRAMGIDDADPDVNACLGDLYSRSSHQEDAKKCYDKIVAKERHDPRAMLALGNLYFSSLPTKDGKYDANFKNSYKFFHHVLNEHKSNVYAANGLAMCCAEKQEYDVARDIFSRARETNMHLTEDICINLAHVHVAQGRLVDAEHLYQATLKAVPRSTQQGQCAERLCRLTEYASLAQYKNKRFDDAIYSLLRSIRIDPGCLRYWHNVAVVSSDMALSTVKKEQKSLVEIEYSERLLRQAQRLFGFLGRTKIPQGRGLQFDRDAVMRAENLCKANQTTFVQLKDERRDMEEKQRDERRKHEEKHAERQRIKHEEKERTRLAEEEDKKRTQALALERAIETQARSDGPSSAPVEATGAAVKRRKSVPKKTDYDHNDSGSDSEYYAKGGSATAVRSSSRKRLRPDFADSGSTEADEVDAGNYSKKTGRVINDDDDSDLMKED